MLKRKIGANMIQGTKETIEQALLNIKNAEELMSQPLYKVETTVLWMDLLGFRGHMDEKNWDFHEQEVNQGMKRVNVLHETALLSMDEQYQIVQLNDAIVISQDIPTESPQEVIERFLTLANRSFEIACLADRNIGGCGVRGVIARGIRYNLRANSGWKKAPSNLHGYLNPAFYCPSSVMMNTGFGRAYSVESLNDKRIQLLKASSLYVEQSLVIDYGAKMVDVWDLNNAVNLDKFGSFLLVRQ